MTPDLDTLLAAAADVPADSLAADAASWLAGAIARGVRISPRLVALVMQASGTSDEQLRDLVARERRRHELVAKVHAGRAASRRLDAAQQRADRAAEHVRQITAEVEQAMRAGEQARGQLLDPALMTPHQAERLRVAAAVLADVGCQVQDAAERHRITQLRVQAIRDQVDAASCRPAGGATVSTARLRLEQLAAEQRDQQAELTRIRQIAADARRVHDDLVTELIGGVSR